MLVYCLLDRKLLQFGQGHLVVERNDEAIRRSVVDAVRGSSSLIEKHPEDFDLMCVGEFDQESGALVGALPRLVANVGDLLEALNAAR